MPKLDFSLNKDFDVLKLWKDHSPRFCILANMASDFFSIPITTVASKSIFSIRGHVLNMSRSRLLPRKVQALNCTCGWFHGFTPIGNVLKFGKHALSSNKESILNLIISIFVGLEEEELEDDNGLVKDSNDSCISDIEGEVRQTN